MAAINAEPPNQTEAGNNATTLGIISDERSLRAMDRLVALKPEWFQTHLAFALWEAWGGWNAAGRTGDPHPAWQWALEAAEPETRAQTKTILADMGTVNDYYQRHIARMFGAHYKHPPTAEELKVDSVWQAILKGATPEWQKNVLALMQTE